MANKAADKAQDATSGPQTPAKAVKRIGPGALAKVASERLGREVNAKRVRSVARETLARFDKAEHPEYQSHEYTVDEARDLLATLATTGRGSGTASADEARAMLSDEGEVVA